MPELRKPSDDDIAARIRQTSESIARHEIVVELNLNYSLTFIGATNEQISKLFSDARTSSMSALSATAYIRILLLIAVDVKNGVPIEDIMAKEYAADLPSHSDVD